MAADYRLDEEMEEIAEQNKDFIAEKAAIYIVDERLGREEAIERVKNVLVEREESKHDIAICIPGDGNQPEEWLTKETQLPSLPTDTAKRKQVIAIETKIRKMLD
ncbi:hypothetical protein [Pectobacterium brasiliense]|uniref:hypothetical protein n=1 Tax=Pectobacterium brasiliense TaxID=180957 RepID=UPI001968D029|nr:hypothetical protein [Pectobacterium brasiliense]MBN3263150.1 hypothetical protein [Pectobacterium brasiliense]